MDRCNNLSTMADGFDKPKMRKYVKQTEQYVLPLLKVVKDTPAWNNAAWLIRYQMVALLETFKRLL
jgi:GTP pyrophosphokinase